MAPALRRGSILKILNLLLGIFERLVHFWADQASFLTTTANGPSPSCRLRRLYNDRGTLKLCASKSLCCVPDTE